MARLPSGIFWICPVCRNANTGTYLWCSQCTYRPNKLVDVVTRNLKFVPNAVLLGRALKKSIRDKRTYTHLEEAYSKSEGTKEPSSRPDRYAEISFHKKPTPSAPAKLPNRTPIKPTPIKQVPTKSVTPGPEPSHSQSQTQKHTQTKPAPAQELNPDLFELYCAEWCTYLGHKNVKVTRSTKDGGIDITGDTFIAQVKLQELPVGVKPIRELAGVLTTKKKSIAYFFALNGYSAAALQEGEELGLALYEVKPFTSKITAKTPLAALILEDAEATNEKKN